ncbi:hypothetical protein PoB_002431000 [Plakobranchus ocellatus]|uniref:Uncharacterized protein n=1 Tax=Plakobranchus ocellatus TaxID=259542 RepID=A0AAV3ZQ09_9GAST|nr:hypothetical protein PoB_002431000 [Plakobranchus ocellatus]
MDRVQIRGKHLEDTQSLMDGDHCQLWTLRVLYTELKARERHSKSHGWRSVSDMDTQNLMGGDQCRDMDTQSLMGGDQCQIWTLKISWMEISVRYGHSKSHGWRSESDMDIQSLMDGDQCQVWTLKVSWMEIRVRYGHSKSHGWRSVSDMDIQSLNVEIMDTQSFMDGDQCQIWTLKVSYAERNARERHSKSHGQNLELKRVTNSSLERD